jgi:phosphoribosylanthranilate isomerase
MAKISTPPRKRTRVKICGLTRDRDVLAAADLGADAVGLVFYDPSPRSVEIDQARRLLDLLPPFVTAVGLFVDADPDYVRAVLASVPIDLVQFHGDESAGYCSGFDRPWIKAIRMRPGVDLIAAERDYRGAQGLLLDTYDPGTAGGTGRSFNWGLIPQPLASRVVLAGGLNPGNVADAIRRVRPWGVDVSGGVESAKGIKDQAAMAAFMQEVRHGDES